MKVSDHACNDLPKSLEDVEIDFEQEISNIMFDADQTQTNPLHQLEKLERQTTGRGAYYGGIYRMREGRLTGK